MLSKVVKVINNYYKFSGPLCRDLIEFGQNVSLSVHLKMPRKVKK